MIKKGIKTRSDLKINPRREKENVVEVNECREIFGKRDLQSFINKYSIKKEEKKKLSYEF
jgi:hypothetical protein